MSFGNARIYRKSIRLSDPGAFRPSSYPVWPHPENRKPSNVSMSTNGDFATTEGVRQQPYNRRCKPITRNAAQKAHKNAAK